MSISDRAENSVIADAHPLLAARVLELCAGNKFRVEWISPFECVVWNRSAWQHL